MGCEKRETRTERRETRYKKQEKRGKKRDAMTSLRVRKI